MGRLSGVVSTAQSVVSRFRQYTLRTVLVTLLTVYVGGVLVPTIIRYATDRSKSLEARADVIEGVATRTMPLLRKAIFGPQPTPDYAAYHDVAVGLYELQWSHGLKVRLLMNSAAKRELEDWEETLRSVLRYRVVYASCRNKYASADPGRRKILVDAIARRLADLGWQPDSEDEAADICSGQSNGDEYAPGNELERTMTRRFKEGFEEEALRSPVRGYMDTRWELLRGLMPPVDSG